MGANYLATTLVSILSITAIVGVAEIGMNIDLFWRVENVIGHPLMQL